MFKRLSFGVAGLFALVAASVPALAADPIIDTSGLTPDVSMVGTLGLAICTGLLGIWGVRKVIKLVNRS